MTFETWYEETASKLAFKAFELDAARMAWNAATAEAEKRAEKRAKEREAEIRLEESEWWFKPHADCEEQTDVCRWMHERLEANRLAAQETKRTD